MTFKLSVLRSQTSASLGDLRCAGVRVQTAAPHGWAVHSVAIQDRAAAEFGPRAGRWASADYYVLLNRDGQLAGRLGVLDSKVSVANQIIRVGGIGGVATKATPRPLSVILSGRGKRERQAFVGSPFGLGLLVPASVALCCKPHWRY
jgi:hypothetical protein